MVTFFLYTAWALLPLSLFTIALWNILERISDKEKGKQAYDFFKQGIFCSLVVLLCVVLDRYSLPVLYNKILPELLPLIFYRVILLPVLLPIAAKLVGPSKDILISKSTPTDKTKRVK